VTSVIFRFEERPLWCWAAVLRRLFDAPASGADWKPVVSVLTDRYDDERGLRLAQKLCPRAKIRLGRGKVLAPTVLQREAGFLEASDAARKATLVADLGGRGIAVEVGYDFAGDRDAELAALRVLARDLARLVHAGAAFVPHQDRNLAGLPLSDLAKALEA
jgi:hypothetical protein